MAVTRAGVARLDFGDLVGQDGDVVHLVVSDTALERLRSRLDGSAAAVGPAADPSAAGPGGNGTSASTGGAPDGDRS